jgi:hypothetical protein
VIREAVLARGVTPQWPQVMAWNPRSVATNPRFDKPRAPTSGSTAIRNPAPAGTDAVSGRVVTIGGCTHVPTAASTRRLPVRPVIVTVVLPLASVVVLRLPIGRQSQDSRTRLPNTARSR